MTLSDFWQVPIRKKTAAVRLEAVTLRISEQILNTVADARHAHLNCIALSAMREEAAALMANREAFRDHMRYRREFGLASDIDISEAEAAVFKQEVEIARIGKDLQVARARLNRVMGLSAGQESFKVLGTLSPELKLIPDMETMVSGALPRRPDVQIAQHRVVENRRVLELERLRVLKNVRAGLSYEREAEGGNLLGPRLDIQLPLFDSNQAQIARAEYRLRQSEKELQATMGTAREEISAAFAKVSAARKETSFVREQLLPLRKDVVDYSEKYSDAMQLSMIHLLDARRLLIEETLHLLERLRDLRDEEIELERVSGFIIFSRK